MVERRVDKDKLLIAAARLANERDYWLEKLSGSPARGVFPYDFKKEPESPSTPGDYDSVALMLTEEIRNGLARVSGGSDVRLHMVLTGVLAVLLSRYVRMEDIVLGTPVFSGQEETAGAEAHPLLNTVVPVLLHFSGEFTFKELLTAVRDTIVEAVDNQAYPIDILVEQLGLEGRDDGFPLFDVTLVLENIQQEEHARTTRPAIVFSFQGTGTSFEGRVLYNPLRYEKTGVQRIAGYYCELLQKLIANPDRPLAEINLLTPLELERILSLFNGAEVPYPKEKTIVDLFEEQVQKTPGDTAVSAVDKHNHKSHLTYEQLNQKANQLAALLREKGVGPDIIVAILMERSTDLVVALPAVLKAGGAYLPIDPGYPEKRIRSILHNSGASVLLTKDAVSRPFSFTMLKNISGENAAEPVVTAPRPQVKNFDDLPRPNRTLVDYERYHRDIGIAPVRRTVSLQTSRGCPYNCIYCHKIWPKRHITRSAENIFEEMSWNYQAGIRDFVFIDDIFNLDKTNSSRLLRSIIREMPDVRLYYPNGLRADILEREFIDLMVEAGTVNIDVALESACPRLQKLMKKNLNLEKFAENIRYIAETYPHVILEMEMMHGFPTETEEEAMMTFDFLKTIKWIHFPNLNILKIFPNTDMYRLALEHGVSKKAIENSTNYAYHELPETLPFPKSFTRQYQARLLEEYFLSKERMLSVLPHQMRVLTEGELVKKYDTYLPMEIRSFPDILRVAGISREELGDVPLKKDDLEPLNYNERIKKFYPGVNAKPGAFRLLLLDLSQFFSDEAGSMLYDVVEEPLGLMYLLTYVQEQLGAEVEGKIAKSRIDFNGYEELKDLVTGFKPDLIGIRTLSYYRQFFHRTVSIIKEWGVEAPVISGGPYATSDYTLILRDPNVRLVVFGEGEQTFTEIVRVMMENGNRLPGDDVLREIPGIAFVPCEERIRLQERERDVLILDTLRERLEALPVGNPVQINSPRDLLYLISTSGSTGTPKTLMMEHRGLVNLLHYQKSATVIDTRRVLQFASIAFDVSFQEIFTALSAGGTIYMLTEEIRSNVPLLLEYIQANEITTLFLPPAFLKFIFDEEEYAARFPSCVKHVITAGEQLLVTDRMKRYFRENRVYLHNHYGPAETHVVTALTLAPGQELPRLPSIGKPIANTRILIIDAYGNLQPVGVAGELCITGDPVGRGYVNNPQLTTEKFLSPLPLLSSAGTPGPSTPLYRTGDLACWLPDGNIRFLGRMDYQVQVRGYRIELEEIEKHLLDIDYIREAVVIDRVNDSGDTFLCAYVVLKDAVEADVAFDPTDVRDKLSAVLPDYMIPSYFTCLQEIPLNASGKVNRRALPEPGAGGSAGYTAPRDEVEKKLAGIWAEVLEKEKEAIGIDDNFFEMGGHSLKGTVLIAKIHQAFGVRLQLVELFKYPTIRLSAEFLKQAGADGADIFVEIEPAPRQDFYPLSPAQKRLYVLQQLDPRSTTYNMPFTAKLGEEPDREKLAAAFKALIRRHESLRTSFVSHDSEPVQRIHDFETIDFSIEYHPEEIHHSSFIIHHFIRPFDLSQAPLLRVGLIPLTAHEHILVVDMHHIISDGVTLEIFINEFLSLYEGETLPPLKLQYKDYAFWQQRMIASGVVAKQEAFWLERFRGELPELKMPLDYPRPSVRSSEGDTRSISIDEELTAAVRKAARETGTTLYQFLLAVYKVLLHKYTGQSDIIVGSPVSGRRHVDLRHMMGVFINMVAVRSFPDPGKTFREYLDEVMVNALAAYENQDYPFDELVSKLGLQGVPGRNPIFDVGFLYTTLETKKMRNPSLAITPYDMSHDSRFTHRVSRFDMLFGVLEDDRGRISFGIEYATGLFKAQSINGFLGHYLDIVRQVTGNPDVLLDEITVAAALKPIETQKTEIIFGF